MPISFEPNELFDYLYIHLPSFIRYNNRVDEKQLIRLRKDTNIEIAKNKNLIPLYYSQEEYYEFIEVLNKFKRKIHNANYHQNTNYRKTKTYREKATFKKMEKYDEIRESHNEYCRLYNNTNNRLINHYNKHRHSLLMIKLIGMRNNLFSIVRNKKNNKLKMIALSILGTIRSC